MLGPGTIALPVSDELLEILCCPVSREPLERLAGKGLAALNEEVRSGQLRHADGSLVTKPLEEGLRTADGRRVYRVDDSIPVLLPELGIIVGKG